MRYDQQKDSPDGRGLARALAAMQKEIRANRRTAVGDVPDPTPPAAPVTVGALTALNTKGPAT